MGSCKVNTVENKVLTTVPSHWDYVLIKLPVRGADSSEKFRFFGPALRDLVEEESCEKSILVWGVCM